MSSPEIMANNTSIKYWLKIALLNLFIAVSIGATLRYAFVNEITWFDFRNFLHAHSHVAMLGWVYLAFYAFLIGSFLAPDSKQGRFYNILFWLTQAAVLGMLIAFPIYGYAAWSIGFSMLHMLLSYVFVARFLKDLKSKPSSSSVAQLFIKTALFFMVLSTLALWAIGPIMALDLRGSGWYHMSIQFYLHFQFNGWFAFGVLGLFFKLLEDQGIEVPRKTVRRFYGLLVVSCLLTYALAVAWSNPENFIFWINGLGVFLQFLALLFFLEIIWGIKEALRVLFGSWVLRLFQISLVCFIFRILIQTLVMVPYIATVAYTVRNFVIGFIHLMLLGIITHFLFAFGLYKKWWRADSFLAKTGLSLFVTGFILSEALLFFQGLLLWQAFGFLPYYYEGIFLVSSLMPVGIFCWGVSE